MAYVKDVKVFKNTLYATLLGLDQIQQEVEFLSMLVPFLF